MPVENKKDKTESKTNNKKDKVKKFNFAQY